MRKKLKKDFMEWQKIKEETRILGKENIDIEESTKLKHGDDYRGKTRYTASQTREIARLSLYNILQRKIADISKILIQNII